MAHVAVIGAGPTGLATSLFLARRGHRVSLIEKDAAPAPDDPEACFQSWSRRGVAQARQPHLLLARSSAILRQEAPDVIEALEAAGCNFVTIDLDAVQPDDPETPYLVAARRLVFEAVLRRRVLAEPNVRFHGVEATGIVVGGGEPIPAVTGVRLEGGGEIAADLTVDAAGRFSKAPDWLGAEGLGAPTETFQDCGFCYMTRWRRLRSGETRPAGPMPVGVPTAFSSFFMFLADADTFCLGMTLSLRDPLTAQARRPETFERLVGAVPVMAAWQSRSEPISEINVLARIENRSRSLIRDGAPLVAGFTLLGDSAMHTNPTRGRGVSMGYRQAQWLADALARHDPASAELLVELEAWRVSELGPWFDAQVRVDGFRNATIDAALAGEPPPPMDPISRAEAAIMALSQRDPAIAAASNRVFHMLATPADLTADPAIQAAVAAYLAEPPAPPPPAMTRATFEALVSQD